MEEQFILRVPPQLAERLRKALTEDARAGDEIIDLSFGEDGRTGTFSVGGEEFPAALLDLPCVAESWKTYDDNSLIKTADIGQMILVRENGEKAPEGPESRHGITPPMRDVRKRRFRREADLNPGIVANVEKDLQAIIAGGTAKDVELEVVEEEEDADEGEEGEDDEINGVSRAKKRKRNSLTGDGEADGKENEGTKVPGKRKNIGFGKMKLNVKRSFGRGRGVKGRGGERKKIGRKSKVPLENVEEKEVNKAASDELEMENDAENYDDE